MSGFGMSDQAYIEVFSMFALADIHVSPGVVPTGGVNRRRLDVFAENHADEFNTILIVTHGILR